MVLSLFLVLVLVLAAAVVVDAVLASVQCYGQLYMITLAAFFIFAAVVGGATVAVLLL